MSTGFRGTGPLMTLGPSGWSDRGGTHLVGWGGSGREEMQTASTACLSGVGL